MIRYMLIYFVVIFTLAWLFPDLNVVWRVIIALAVALSASAVARIWREVSISMWLERIPDGTTATVGDHVFTRDHGYWSDGEQALDDEELRHYATTEGNGMTTFSLPGAARRVTQEE